jgi:hypothetical protein
MKSSPKKNLLILFGILGWLFAICVGLRLILDYENAPGGSGVSAAVWPEDSEIPRTPDVPTLVTMVHPHCPCSRASIGELALLMVQGQGRLNANVVFVKPQGFPEEWEKTDLWASAAVIPGVTVRVDNDGIEARRFGSRTSGQILLYSTDGQLLFSGGITSSRGHSGANDGRNAIVAILTQGSAEQRETPVFGCPLFGEGSSSSEIKDSCNELHSNP